MNIYQFADIQGKPLNSIGLNEELRLMVARGAISGAGFIEKFGRNRTIASGTQETIWDGGGLYNYSTSADIDTISSSNAGDSQILEIQGQTFAGVEIIQNATLNGQNKVVLSTPLYRIYRVKNLGSTLLGNAYVSVDGTLTGGVPTASNMRAEVLASTNQTNMTLYSIPSGKTGYLFQYDASLLRASGTTAVAADIDFFRKGTSGSWRSTKPKGIQNTGKGDFVYPFPFPLTLPERMDIEVRATPTAIADISAGFTILLIDN